VRNESTLVWCEGELDALNLIGRGVGAVTATCGAGAALAASFVIPDLTGRVLYVCGDNDEAGRKLNAELPARLFAHGAAAVSVIEWPAGTPEKWDVSDHFAAGRTVEALGL